MTRQQRLFEELLARYAPEVAAAFREAVADIAAQADLQRIITALQRGDIDAAIEALHLDPAAYAKIEDAVRSAYNAAGQGAVSTLPKITDGQGHAVVIRFDGRNYRAEAWLRSNSADLVTRIVDDQKVAVRAALTEGMVKGQNPRTVALDIVGRTNRATGAREGGIIGLTSQQEEYARTAREELASGDPAQLRHYLTRTRRDKRFDRTVTKAIEAEKPVPAEIVGKATVAYQRRLLQLRGETIGKVEAFTAIAEGKHEAYSQAVDAGKISAAAITKTWRHFGSEHPRIQHIAMAGKKAGFNELFILPDGTAMRFPHDPRAPISHRAGCKCGADYSIDFFAGLT
jgi:hypothetical protein